MQIPWRRGGVICEMNGFLSQRSLGVRASVLSIQGRLWGKKAVVQLMKEPPQSWRLASEVPPLDPSQARGAGLIICLGQAPWDAALVIAWPLHALPCRCCSVSASSPTCTGLFSLLAGLRSFCPPGLSPTYFALLLSWCGEEWGMGGEREHSLAG